MSDALYRVKGFLPYIVVMFLNAFTDLGQKVTIINTLTKSYDGSELVIYTSIVSSLILLPFVLLFTPAGFLSDKYPKNMIMRYSALFAVFIALGITASYYMGAFWIAFGLTFLLAMQSALYSPAKFGYIKELLGVNRLARGNAVVQSITIVAILLGTGGYSFLFESLLSNPDISDKSAILQEVVVIGWLLVAGSLLELFLTFFITKTKDTDANIQLNFKKYITYGYLAENMSLIYKKAPIWYAIVGLSLWYGVSNGVLSTFPSYAKEAFHTNNVFYIQGTMLIASLGIIIGSFWAAKLSKNYIELGIVPMSALGMMISIVLITFIDSLVIESINFFVFGVFSGLFIIPLNALLQYHANKDDMGRVLAGNNFVQSLVMLLFLYATAGIAYLQISSKMIFYIMAVAGLVMVLLALYKLPQAFFRLIVYLLISRRYKLNVTGFENLPKDGGVLLLGNHTSWIDWAIISMASIRRVHFVMERSIYERWYVKWFVKHFHVIPISSRGGSKALETIQQRLQEGQVVCLFPEGAISRTGNLGKFQKGFENFTHHAKGVIVPFYMQGLWGSLFSRSTKKVRANTNTAFKRTVVVAFGAPLPISTNSIDVKKAVFELSFTAWKEYSNSFKTIQYSWLKMAKKRKKAMSVADTLGTELSSQRLLTAVLLFAKKIKVLSPEKNVGLMLPTTAAGVITNMATLVNAKVVCNLNYTASEKTLRAAIEKADVKTIYTAHAFVAKLKDRGLDVTAFSDVATIVYLEDVKKTISTFSSLLMLLRVKFLPTFILKWLYFHDADIDDTAEIMFSSGSEGEPKGIELTHRNVIMNAKQITTILNPEDDEIFMSVLPLFHAMGLNIMTIKPLIEGVPFVCHPDPTDAESIGKAVAQYKATIIVATSTFYRIYTKSKKLEPWMFDSLRFVVAGAEKLSMDVYKEFKDKFGKVILQGYGVTETCPVSGCNMPDRVGENGIVQLAHKVGTVGMPMPGTAYKIVDPDTLEELPVFEDGLILIGGVQTMKHYLKDEKLTKDAFVEYNGQRYYKTGDKGHLDEDGFLTIVDRYSRFAKLGGEMVSLSIVEQEISALIDDENVEIIASNVPDDKKGEKVILLVSGMKDVEVLRKKILASAINPLSKPAKIFSIDEIPILGSGKRDFATTKKIALRLTNE